jgi:glycosyltransferase involved in cell wall biosynthesis
VRVFAWAADNAGCAHYRLRVPLGHLRTEGGLDVRIAERMTPRDHTADIIVGQRVCLPGASQAWQDLASSGHPGLVYEIDDDLFVIDHTSTRAHGFYSAPDVQARIRQNLAVARLVTVSTHPLAAVVAQHTDAPIVVLPNAIPDQLLGMPSPNDILDPTQPITIGWAGSGTHAMDWGHMAGQVERWLRRNPDVELHTMGTDYAQGVAPHQRRHTPWLMDVWSYYGALDFHVGLAPLRPHVFNQSKSDVKALEYAALGIPVLASDTGPYAGSVVDGVTGFRITRDHQWGQRLTTLTRDHALREAMARDARAWASHRTVSKVAHQWLDAYHTLTAPTGRNAR